MDPYAVEAVNLLQQVLSILGVVQQSEQIDRIETTVNGLVGLVGEVFAQTLSLTNRLSAIETSVAATRAATAAIGHPMQSGEPVTLSASGASDLVTQIWLYSDGLPTFTAFELLWETWATSIQVAYGLPLIDYTQPFLRLYYNNETRPYDFELVTPYPPLDYHTIQPGDATPIAWVERQYASYGWQSFFAFSTDTVAYQDPTIAYAYWVLAMTQPEFDFWKSRALSAPSYTAPVWPGLANATLGTAVTLANGVTVPGPLSGIILNITSGFENLPGYPFGTNISYKNLGGVTFTSDNGQNEYASAFGFPSAVVCPKQMAIAASATVRTIPGLVGTVTPFTIS